jgi:polar amino acid transport system substrate-binding protein
MIKSLGSLDCSKLVASAALTAISLMSISTAFADPLLDKLIAGEPIRIGFANEVPWAYPGEGNIPLGFANLHAVGVLKAMGAKKIEPVVTEWGGLIPGLKAKRFDVITGGMYILSSRCENVNFAEPMGVFGDAFIVAPGNPKNLKNYQDIKKAGATLVTGAGYNIVEAAKKEGILESKIMTVPGPTEILASVKAGRADAGGVTFFTAQNLAKQSGGMVEVTDPAALPVWTKNWVGIAFRPSDTDFLAAFNKAQAEYLGSPEMLAAVASYEYTKAQLPGDTTTAYACSNR